MLRLGHKFSRDQIRNQLKNIRQSIYPSDNNLVFTHLIVYVYNQMITKHYFKRELLYHLVIQNQ